MITSVILLDMVSIPSTAKRGRDPRSGRCDMPTNKYNVPERLWCLMQIVFGSMDNPKIISYKKLERLAKLPIKFFNPDTKEVYEWIETTGNKDLIPLNNWNMVMSN